MSEKEVEVGVSKPGENVPHPHTLSQAYSEIQKLAQMEFEGARIRKEFVTFTDVTSFANVGMKSAIRDTMIWVVGSILGGSLVYFADNYYLQTKVFQILFLTLKGSPFYWFTKFASLFGIMASTGLCVMMGRYYIGNTTKRAISNLWVSRFAFLVYSAAIAWAMLGYCYKNVLSDRNILNIIGMRMLSEQFRLATFAYLHNFLKPELYETSVFMVVLALASIMATLIMAIVFKYVNKKDLELDGKRRG